MVYVGPVSVSWRGVRRGVIISVCTSYISSFHEHLTDVPCTDTGASQLIANGKIKLKSGPQIERFTEHAIRFDDGSELEADVIVFATGCAASPRLSPLYDCKPTDGDHRLGDCRAHIQRVCGATLVEKCKPIWGLDKEGEINGAWRDMGVRGLWYMMGMAESFFAKSCGS
jgi:cation diffusion facilitator CzcD-associated flavoprotein CzcO